MFKFLTYVCFVVFVTHNVTGQTIDPVCSNVRDFDKCSSPWSCDEKVSLCTCFDGQPFCRCNNQKGEFYIAEDCSQKWTILTFALVASLPGLALAILVGVIVYVVMLSSNKSHKSSSAGYGQTMNNPYARDSPSRNPYDNRSASLEHRNDYRQHGPSHPYEDVVCTKHQFENVSNSAYSPPQFYASDRGKTRGGFPRPHVNLQY
ncbi:hypothetical protein E1301_Tti017365 [Triplophysa tibetana]|uniref:Uncharacterized protein n=1 Tax=Triplophysa tibetana TaxID=1572043 RepID=A0A5A9P5J5_9TELE|nr:hypothetical protein E1301_Tti017365 [Triplophysa tibetana]